MDSPTNEAMQWLTLKGKEGKPKVVFISGDEEYRSEEALPQLAKILSTHHGFNCTVLFAQDPKFPGIVDPNYTQNIPGLEHLVQADLMVLFTRFRALPDDQMKYIDDYLKSGKPVIGMRTATHAFNFSNIDFESSYLHYGNYYEEENEWKDGFGRLVMGERWVSHHGSHGNQSTKGLIAEEAVGHPILQGIQDGDVWGPTDVYGVRLPLPGDAQPLLLGQVIDRAGEKDKDDNRLGMRPTDKGIPGPIETKKEDGTVSSVNKNDPMMPVAWVKSYQLPDGKSGKCFATTMGASTDLLEEGTRRLMINAAFWLLGIEVPAKANIAIVGPYQPTKFAFLNDEYWEKRNLQIESLP